MNNVIHLDDKIKFRKIDELLDEPVVVIVDEFDEEHVWDFQRDMAEAHQTRQPVIPILINSYGGDVYGLLSMMSTIDHAKVPVATIVTGHAMSCGAMLFCYGTEGYRFLDPNATLMMHQISSFSDGKIEDIKGKTIHIDRLNQKLYKRVSLHLGHPENYLHDLAVKNRNNTDWYIEAKEAKKRNMANHLRIPRFDVRVSVTMEFG
jgi:ATP-dependent Clp protease, protease subunit